MRKNRGFTLIELLVVIAIIGILASVVLASLNDARKKSRDARRVADIKNIQLALELYYDSNAAKYPTSGAGIGALDTAGFLPSTPVDPVNTGVYVYTYVGLDDLTSPATCDNTTTSCMAYHLGSFLEDNGSPALTADTDFDSTGGAGFIGNNDTRCGAAGSGGTDQCYDVTP